MRKHRLLISIFVAASLFVVGGFAITSTSSHSQVTEKQQRAEPKAEERQPVSVVEETSPEPEPRLVEIKIGDTLASVAKEEATTPQKIFNANETIAHPDNIRPGLEVRIPDESEELPDRYSEVMAKIAAQEAETAQQKAVADAKAAATAPSQPARKPARVPTTKPAQPAPVREPAPVRAAPSGDTSVWDRLAQCEAGGNWSINTGNGYYGGLQFSLSSWRAVGGTGYPHEASKAEQIVRGEKLKAIQGWGAWPSCSSKLGLR